jgi:hypothetical protein
MQMSWAQTVNIAKMTEGSFRSIAGYASESLVVGRAMLCGYIIFVKAWRDSKYDAVLDANGSLFRIEIKGTAGDKSISTSSGARSGEQISREAESRERPLSKIDCDWLIATTSMDSHCWIIPIEFIEILGLLSISISDLDKFKEKWDIFVSQDPNVQPYLKTGFRELSEYKILQIASSLGIDSEISKEIYSFDPENKRKKKYSLPEKDRLVIAIWEKIFSNLPSK